MRNHWCEPLIQAVSFIYNVWIHSLFSSLLQLFWEVLFIASWYFHTPITLSFFLSPFFSLPIPITLSWLFQSIPVALSGPVSSFANLMVRKAAAHCYHFLRRSFTVLFILPLCAVADIVSRFCDKKSKKYLNIFFPCNIEESLFIHLRICSSHLPIVGRGVFFSLKDWFEWRVECRTRRYCYSFICEAELT